MNLKRPTERIRVSENFYLDEFIDPYTYFTEIDNGLSKIDKRLFTIAQLLRDLDGKPKTINNWWSYYKGKMNTTEIRQIIFNIEHSQAHRKWSGLRTVRCSV